MLEIGDPHIEHFENANRDQVLNCIKDKSGSCLSKDEFAMYVEQGDQPQKPRYTLDDEAKEALRDYYDAVHTLSEAQSNFTASTKVLEQKIKDKSVFLDIIRQVQLPAVQISIRTIEKEEKLHGKTYREVTLLTHLPNFKTIYRNTNEQTRTMAAFIYYVLYEEITGLQKSQIGCAAEFRCQTTPFKRLITGKRQPGVPGRYSLRSAGGGRSGRKLEEIAAMEGVTPAKQLKVTPKPAHGRGKGRGKKSK